jgi:hypothetical protein
MLNFSRKVLLMLLPYNALLVLTPCAKVKFAAKILASAIMTEKRKRQYVLLKF